jgi:DNA-binding Lrp family transcriptional regulator
VRHCLESLKKRGCVRALPYVDLSRLGYIDSALYFSLALESQGALQRLLSFMAHSSKIGRLAALCGEYQYAAAVYSRKRNELDQLLTLLGERCRGGLFNKAAATRVSRTIFRSKHLCCAPSAVESITCGQCGMDAALDRIDREILNAMADAPNQSRVALAQVLHLPLSTVNYRVKNLEARGVIAGYAYRLRRSSFGLSKFRLLVCHRRESRALREEILRFSALHPNITCCVNCIGDWSCELSVEVEDPAQIPAVSQALYERFGEDLTHIKTVMVLNHLKTPSLPFQASSAPLRDCA